MEFPRLLDIFFWRLHQQQRRRAESKVSTKIVNSMVKLFYLGAYGSHILDFWMWLCKEKKKEETMEFWFVLLLENYFWSLQQQFLKNLPYSCHYNPRFVYFLPTFWSPKTLFQRASFKILAQCMALSNQERVIVAPVQYS